jgi:hypothetical protein
MPAPPLSDAAHSWPDYAASEVAGICRSLTTPTARAFELLHGRLQLGAHVQPRAQGLPVRPDRAL